MNIFFLSYDTQQCAQWHIDRHVSKMRVETAQILCDVWRFIDPKTTANLPCKKFNPNHPSVKWASLCIENYLWLIDLGLALCDEKDYRFGFKPQESRNHIEYCQEMLPNLSEHGSMIFPTYDYSAITNLEIRTIAHNDARLAYQEYYRKEKVFDKSGQRMDKWTKRNIPEWYKL